MILVAVSLGTVVASGTTLGCDHEDDRPDPAASSPAPASSVAQALGLDARALAEVPIDPAPAAGDLRAEIDAFTTIDACVAQHALDPLVGDAVRAIGYETFLRDACRVLEATKLKDVKKCDGIDAGGLRSRCQAAVAMSTGNVDVCPWMIPDEHAQGRDPTCIAVSTHDRRMCAGELRARRATCEALADRSDARCASALSPTEQAGCKREALRWKGLIDAPSVSPGKELAVHGKLDLKGADGTPDPSKTDADVTIDVQRGVVLRIDRSGVTRFELGSRRELGSTSFVPGPGTRARLAASLQIDPKRVAQLDHLELDVPGATSLVYPGVRCECRVELAKVEPKRAGEVKLTIDGAVGVPPHAYKIHADIATFVRDVIDEGRVVGMPARPAPTAR